MKRLLLALLLSCVASVVMAQTAGSHRIAPGTATSSAFPLPFCLGGECGVP